MRLWREGEGGGGGGGEEWRGRAKEGRRELPLRGRNFLNKFPRKGQLGSFGG